MQYATDLEIAERAALAAGKIVAARYAEHDIAVETKPDRSPVTIADREANTAIVELLHATRPDDAILSEELPDDPARVARSRVWIVDPLDGTRDFIARSDEFSVHVGLAVDGVAVVGAVYQPVTDRLYAAAAGGGAWVVRDGKRARIAVSSTSSLADIRVGISRQNASTRLERFLTDAGFEHRVPMGASTKHAALAEGRLDAVIHLGKGEYEWDTCAPEVVIREAGGVVSDGDGRPFLYNQPDPAHYRGSIASNGVCHAALVALVSRELESEAR